jgi:hypothetical protein
MGSTTRRCGVYGGEYAPTGPVCVVEEERENEASETGQRLRTKSHQSRRPYESFYSWRVLHNELGHAILGSYIIGHGHLRQAQSHEAKSPPGMHAAHACEAGSCAQPPRSHRSGEPGTSLAAASLLPFFSLFFSFYLFLLNK